MVLRNEWIDIKSWSEKALCKNLDTSNFFPKRGEATAPIKLVCGACPVVKPCLEYAMKSSEKFGVWGGTSERERRRIRGMRARQIRQGIKLPLSRLMAMCGINPSSLKEADLEPFSGEDDFYR
tara:strand:+ start:904 stop:1272 length:369 start_codon:yes stop_codon:yes gene_type:complete